MTKSLSNILKAGSLTTTLGVSKGGTGLTTITANNILLGNGASAIQTVAPGNTGNLLTSNNGTWVSSAPPITLPAQTNNNGKYLTTDGSNASWANVVSGLVSTSIQTANVNASVNDLVRCNTTAGGFTVTFPASPVDGSIIGILDTANKFAANNVTILPNTGKTIEGDSTSMILDINGTYVTFMYISSTSNWRLQQTPRSQSSANKTILNISNAYTVTANDLGRIINCTANTFTVSLTAAATLGSGFNCSVWNTSTSSLSAYVITIDPNASETIDGMSTLLLRSGEGLDIVCDGTNWQIANKKPMRGYAENYDNTISRNIASGWNSLVLGRTGTASGTEAISIGSYQAVASGQGSLAIGTGTGASLLYSVAIGTGSSSNGAKSAGTGAIALGGSYASGADSFAAAITNNTSSFGATGSNSIAIGRLAKASGANSVAISSGSTGVGAVATGAGAIALGGSYASGADSFAAGIADNTSSYGATGAHSISFMYSSKSTNNDSVAIGNGAIASGDSAYAVGKAATASGTSSWATQYGTASALSSVTFGGLSAQIGKYTYANGYNFSAGIAQSGKIVLYAITSTTTAVILTSNGSGASTDNQLIVATSQAMVFFGTLIAKQSGSNNMAAYKISGAISNSGGTIVLSAVTVEKIIDSIGLGVEPTFTADSTNKALAVTSGYKSATIIRWVINLDTAEVTLV